LVVIEEKEGERIHWIGPEYCRWNLANAPDDIDPLTVEDVMTGTVTAMETKMLPNFNYDAFRVSPYPGGHAKAGLKILPSMMCWTKYGTAYGYGHNHFREQNLEKERQLKKPKCKS
jgi:hypothetical protein